MSTAASLIFPKQYPKKHHNRALTQSPSGGALAERWRDTVSMYSGLALSKNSDLLPALSGLAKQMQEVRGSEYLAGLWKDSFMGLQSVVVCSNLERASSA